jgi:hypothetical protein
VTALAGGCSQSLTVLSRIHPHQFAVSLSPTPGRTRIRAIPKILVFFKIMNEGA